MMTPEDREQFGLTLAAMASAYREEGDEAMAEGYWNTIAGGDGAGPARPLEIDGGWVRDEIKGRQGHGQMS